MWALVTTVLVFDFTLEGEMPEDEVQAPKPNVFKGNFAAMSGIFQEWQEINQQQDSQAKWDRIHNLYQKACSRYIPPRKNGVELGRHKWMTRKALQAIDNKINQYKV